MKGEDGGNAGRWKTRKTNHRFSTFPTALGNRCAIPTFPPPQRSRGKVEIQKQDSHFPTALLPSYNSHQKGGLAADRFAPAFRLILG
jgi:hypothetical protein